MNALIARLAAPRLQVGFVLMRWSVGLCLLWEHVSLYPERHYFWGETFRRISYGAGGREWMLMSLFDLHSGLLFFELVLLAGIMVSAMFAAGMGGRLVKVAAYVSLVHMHNANWLILDGGDNLMRLVLFYMMFSSENPRSVLNSAIHNLSMFAVVFQTCLLYFFTGFYKAAGEAWQTGVAAYYALRTQQFAWPGISEIVYGNEYIVVAATYGTVVFELAFPFLLLNRRSRYMAIALGIAFHSGTAVLMGLIGFSWSILSVYFLLLTDGEYGRLREYARRLTTAGRTGGDVLLFDGDCSACNRFVAFVFARNPSIQAAPIKGAVGRQILHRHARDADRLESMYVVSDYGSDSERLHERSGALVFVLVRLESVLWRAVGWLIWLCPAWIADAAYRFSAARRNDISARIGECDIKQGRRILR